MIFVVGNSRSGTTLMGRILGRHPRVFTFNELHFFEQLWHVHQPPPTLDADRAVQLAARLMTIQRDGYYTQRDPAEYYNEAPQVVDPIEPPITPPKLYAAFIDYELAHHGKQIGCDHTPRNLYYLGDLLAMYPDARAIVIVRDPRDVMLSQKQRWKRRFLQDQPMPWWNTARTWAGYHPITMSLLWRGGVRAGDHVSAHPRVQVHRFEHVVQQPEQQITQVCKFLGLDFVPDMLEVPRIMSSHERDQPEQPGLDPDAVGRWRHGGLSRTEIGILQRLCKVEMRRYGYETAPHKPSPIGLVWSGLTWLVKGAAAFVLNLGRMRRIVPAMRRRLRGSEPVRSRR